MLQQGLRSFDDMTRLQRLANICTQADGYAAKIYWDALQARLGNIDPLTYVLLDRGEYVAWLSAFLFTHNQAEITGLVHPAYRRRGLFRDLLQQLSSALGNFKVNTGLLIFHVQAQNLLNKLVQKGATFHHSEIDMFTQSMQSAGKMSPIEIVPSGMSELELLLELHQQCFPTPIEQVRQRFLHTLNEPNREVFLAKVDGIPMGKIHIKDEKAHTLIHDFCIIPAYQHKGYGRSLLLNWYAQWGKNDTNTLYKVEVLGDNQPAINLYKTCGFAIKSEYVFLQFDIGSKSNFTLFK
jgi:ribosomal protein S18 acetylase RimI-like enzyme